jgi:UDP:flavonoid glycosyltransferase YjiC (YdhE family)
MSRQAAAIVSQTPKEFDLPGIPWPPQFHYAGPFFDDAGREPIPFRWEKLDGRPLIYASLGTLVNGMAIIYQTILAAVGRMSEIQVVLARGNNIDIDELGPFRPTSSWSTKRLSSNSSYVPRSALHTPDSTRRLNRSCSAYRW